MQFMDTHTFSQAIHSCESLPEAVRSRALKIGEKLSRDEDRAELARRIKQADERARQAEVEADQSLLNAERQITQIEHGLKRAERSFEEEGAQKKELKKAEKKLDRLTPSSSTSSDASC